MRFVYHDKIIVMDSAWWRLASDLGMVDFCLSEDGFREVLSQGKSPVRFERRRSGIYFWLAENGEAYVGQAVDVQSRLRQHLRHHPDLISAAFLPVSPDQLDVEERRIVSKVEAAFRLRNVKLVKATASLRPLDDFLTIEEHDEFVRNGNRAAWLSEVRRDFPMLLTSRRAKERRFDRDAERERVKMLVTDVVNRIIPRPFATENRFWSASYLGEGAVRLNVGQQEVFTCAMTGGSEEIRIISPKRLKFFAARTSYETGSFENRLSLKETYSLLKSERSMRPIREGVIWLARHTTPLNLRSHCPWLYVPRGHET